MVEPIAVIGLDAKLPCDGDTPEKFYELLVAGRSAKGPVPPERYNSAAFWHPDNHRDGVIGSQEGHFIKGNVKAFDAPFFSITPAEAASMDPQQRMLLECVYTALENAGLTMSAVQGSQTGMYVGAFIWDYRDVLIKDVDAPMMYTGSGTIASTLAGRVSWFYDFRGPAMSIDTACSSSMVALHQAVLGLKSGDCDMAIAAGANLILSPEMALELNALGVLNPDGVSYSFDDRAKGYGRSEGIGAVVLKRMSDAVRDGDTIRAVIRNTGSNHDGHSPGLTAPAKEAQTELMRKTYAQAGLDPSETRFFEAHGTGTPVGDPIEAGAISEMFTPYRSAEEPLYIGAVKSNIGHSEGASGIASVIKSVLTLEKGIIPANVWFQKRNRQIPDEWHFLFPTKAVPWPKTKTGLRRLSINSFGVSGTNAHVVIDDAFHFLKEHGIVARHHTVENPLLADISVSHQPKLTNGYHTASSPQLFVLSSHDKDGISRLCHAYKEYLPLMKGDLTDLSFTLGAKRSSLGWRTAIVADSAEALLEALGASKRIERVATESALAFVFTGQGAQWARMGTGLMQYSKFSQSLYSADQFLKSLGASWSLVDELHKTVEQSRINEAEFSQPLCTALQVALVDLLVYWGVYPNAVVGHSSGEIAAAYSIGAISKESAWKIGYWRGKLSAALARSGTQTSTGMAAVGLDVEKANTVIDQVNKNGFQSVHKLTIACMNSRDSQTISGDAAQIDAMVQMLTEKRIFVRKLAVDIAYHSKYMESMSEEYTKCIGEIEAGSWVNETAEPLFFSSTYGTAIDKLTLRRPGYWIKNLVSPVRFSDSTTFMLQAMRAARGENGSSHLITDILEIGPHAALQGPLRSITEEIRGQDVVKYHHMLKRGENDLQAALHAAGGLFTRGIMIDLINVNNNEDLEPKMLIDLPRYPFNHSKEYWYESRLSRNFRNRPYARHELLGAPVNDWDGTHDAVWRNWIRLTENPWVEHHTISGAILYPAAGMLVMVIEGCRQLADRSDPGASIKGFRFREVSFHSALQVTDDAMGIESHLYLRPVKQAALETRPSTWREFQICTAQENDEWREHCRGQVLIEYDGNTVVDNGNEDRLLQRRCNDGILEAQQECTIKLASDELYEAWKNVGLVFGPSFQTVSDPFVDRESSRAVAKVNSSRVIIENLTSHKHIQPHLVHPTMLDGALQVCLAPLIADRTRKQENAIVLTFLDELWVSGSKHSDDGYIVSADTKSHGRKEYEMSCTAIDPNTKMPMVLVSGLIVTEVDSVDKASATILNPTHKAWSIEWKPDPELLDLEQTKTAFGTSDGLWKYVDALAHKNPQMNILELGTGTGDLSRGILKTLQRRYFSYCFTNTDTLCLETARRELAGEFAQFKVLDAQENPAKQGFETQAYDLIIAAADVQSFGQLDLVLDHIHSLLKSHGKLILNTTEDSSATDSLAARLFERGFSGLDAFFQSPNTSTIVTSAIRIEEQADVVRLDCGSYYVVIDPDSDIQWTIAEQITSALISKGHAATYGTVAQYTQFSVTGKQDNQSYSICIVLPELKDGLLISATELNLMAIKSMLSNDRVIWVNRDGSPDTDLITGFATCIRLEKPELEFIVVTFDSEQDAITITNKILEIDTAVTENKSRTETSYKVVNGVISVPRLIEAAALTKHIQKHVLMDEITESAFGKNSHRSLSLQIRDIGLLDSLCFNDDPLHAEPLGEDDVEFRTMATSVNFKDLAVMLGKIQETPVGLEAAGIVTRVGRAVTRFKKGDHVFGFAFKGAFSTHVRALEGTIAHVPDAWSFSEAAVIPIVYTTAYACLYDIGELKKRVTRGMRTTVLIHAAAGGVGQAAIQFAQREGAEIFATAGSLEKRDFLERVYGIPRDHIFSSRDITFKAGIMRMTKGVGVDIVINSLAGDLLRATWECIAPFGRFAEIGLTDIESRARLSMGLFAKCARFEAIELNFMQKTDMARIKDLFARTIEIVLDNGLKRSTPIKTYPISRIQDALRHMQSGKHIGKLVIEIHDEDLVPVVQPSMPAASFASDATYVVSGGFGGLGLDIIRWMAKNGARNLIVTSRRGRKALDETGEILVAELEMEGVKIAAPACDITDKAALRTAISSCLGVMPPIRGCIQASTILIDTPFKDMTIDQWQESLSVKVSGTWNLWQTLTSMTADSTLDFFVMLSSMASTIGNPGQSNYAAGNSYQDALARCLSSQGHNVVALNVPMMSDAGMVATKPKLMEYLYSIGWSHMTSDDLINALDFYCRRREDIKEWTADKAQVVPRLWLPRYTAVDGAVQPSWQHEPRFSHMILQDFNGGYDATGVEQVSGTSSVASLLESVKTAPDAGKIVLDALLEKLVKVLSVDIAELDPMRPMHAYGVDSLVAVELRAWMVKEIGSDVSVFDMVGNQRIADLASKAATTSRFYQE